MQKAHHTGQHRGKDFAQVYQLSTLCRLHTIQYQPYFLTDPKKVFQGLAVNYSTLYLYS